MFEATLIHWRGPAPFLFAPIPLPKVTEIRLAALGTSYGWGMVPVDANIDGVDFTTSLFPKDGTYLLPVKMAVQKRTGLSAGSTARIVLTFKGG
jgi:hypothetical protein